MNKRNKLIFIIASGLFILLIVLAIFLIAQRAGKVNILVKLVPGDANMTIDGQVATGGKQWLSTGEHHIKASREGFQDFDQVVTVQEGDESILVILGPESDEAIQWANENEDIYREAGGLGDREADINVQRFYDEFPIVQILPITYARFSDDYSEYREFRVDFQPIDNGNSIVLTITDRTGNSEQFAKDYIRQQGFEPDNYEFNYVYEPINNM